MLANQIIDFLSPLNGIQKTQHPKSPEVIFIGDRHVSIADGPEKVWNLQDLFCRGFLGVGQDSETVSFNVIIYISIPYSSLFPCEGLTNQMFHVLQKRL